MSIWQREQTESEMKQEKKKQKQTFGYRKAKENFKIICERIADQKRILCNIIVNGKFRKFQ